MQSEVWQDAPAKMIIDIRGNPSRSDKVIDYIFNRSLNAEDNKGRMKMVGAEKSHA
ncbi:MAG: hypothetical protein ABJP02_04740 [Parasphingorhabdus sp.]|uniref:hypothetical protein n=1 Tax=Parasphingorhabdus sp. TaxID=2709688 RepID=UPI00329A133D